MYLLDANALIQPSNQWYDPGFCMAYWDWLAAAHRQGLVSSTQDIGAEIRRADSPQQEALLRWCLGVGKGLFAATTYGPKDVERVGDWVRSGDRPYTAGAQEEFMERQADPFLVAEAVARGGHAVVSLEVTGRPSQAKRSGHTQKEVKLFDVCEGLGIACIPPYQMLLQERARFILDADAPGSWSRPEPVLR